MEDLFGIRSIGPREVVPKFLLQLKKPTQDQSWAPKEGFFLILSAWKTAADLKISHTLRLSNTAPHAPGGFYYFVPPSFGVSLSPPPLIGLSCGCRHPCLTPSCLPTHRPNPPVKLIPNPLWQVEHPTQHTRTYTTPPFRFPNGPATPASDCV